MKVQIESARGLIQSAQIADHPRVSSLAFGPADFMASIAMPTAQPGTPLSIVSRALDFPLQQIIIAARAAGKLIYDGPYFQFADNDGFTKSAEIARGLGADGKWVIHPKQISTCNQIFTPSEVEIEAAKKIVAAYSSSTGATSLAGLLVDKASAEVAQRLLDRVNHFRK